MSGGIKATLVVGGLVAFFLMPVAGPGLEVAVGTLIQTALGSDDQTEAENRKLRGDARYRENGPMKKALGCCSGCDLTWDFKADRCLTNTQMDNQCYMACSPAP